MELQALPSDFIDEVKNAEQNRLAGKLSLLAYEAGEFSWRMPALGLIAEALFNIRADRSSIHYILFTGHMIDRADRPVPRFPASKEKAVRNIIREKLIAIKARLADVPVRGIAGGACGGDILFQETCEEQCIPAELFLALPREKFLSESVAFAGNEWVERFDRLFNKLPHPVLSDNKELPQWLQNKKGYDTWDRTNLWLLNSALVNGGTNMTLLAVWDGKGGDGPGGTEHMVATAKEKGANILLIDINAV